MRSFLYVASALAIGILAGYATAGDCYRTSAVQVQQVAVPVQTVTYTVPVQVQQQVQAAPVCTYATCAPASAPAYQSYMTAAAFAAPTYYTPALQAPTYRNYVPQQPFAIQRQRQFAPVYSTQFVPGQQFGGGFAVQPQFAQAPGGGPISNIIRAIGDVANSPAGTFALGAFVGNGFKFGGPRTQTVVVPGGGVSPAQAALFNASQRRR